ncbi:MAG TPA: response regulator [Bryobacteraceae bacterium]|nr:response regulator [Bryobacteraceae bacterium]
MLLIVDDDPKFLQDAERALDAEVLFARDADQALDLVGNLGAEFSAVLVDLNLPGKDGFSLIIEMRRRFPNLPVIAISGVVQEHALESAKAVGAADALRKPITSEWNTVIFRAQRKTANG